jgi:hypothetical protein
VPKFLRRQDIEIIRRSATCDSERIQQIEFLEQVLLKSEFQLVGYRYFKIARFARVVAVIEPSKHCSPTTKIK